jgi:hypothetical protein
MTSRDISISGQISVNAPTAATAPGTDIGSFRNLLLAGLIALVVFATVPLAQYVAQQREATTPATIGPAVLESVGSAVTNLVVTHTRMSVAISDAAAHGM